MPRFLVAKTKYLWYYARVIAPQHERHTMSAGGGGGTGGGFAIDYQGPIEPEVVETILGILRIGCGEVIPKRNDLVVHCNRIQRCQKCQAMFDNLSKVDLIALIERLVERNTELVEDPSNNYLSREELSEPF